MVAVEIPSSLDPQPVPEAPLELTYEEQTIEADGHKVRSVCWIPSHSIEDAELGGPLIIGAPKASNG